LGAVYEGRKGSAANKSEGDSYPEQKSTQTQDEYHGRQQYQHRNAGNRCNSSHGRTANHDYPPALEITQSPAVPDIQRQSWKRPAMSCL
jgi:hypothetical protein